MEKMEKGKAMKNRGSRWNSLHEVLKKSHLQLELLEYKVVSGQNSRQEF